jgi:hypothetical protein
MASIKDLWLEFLNTDNGVGHCGLCGNHGIIDTTNTAITPAGLRCGVRRYCICPNGRKMKKVSERVPSQKEKK